MSKRRSFSSKIVSETCLKDFSFIKKKKKGAEVDVRKRVIFQWLTNISGTYR